MTTLGPEIVPDPYWRQWTDPGIPDGWAYIGGTDVDNRVEQTAPGGGLRMISQVAAPKTTLRDVDNVVQLTQYQVQWQYSDLTAGVIELSNAVNAPLPGPAGVLHTAIFTTGILGVNMDISAAVGEILDASLSFYSIKQVLPPATRNASGLLTLGDRSVGPIDAARGHGVDIQLTGTWSAGDVYLERSDDVGATWQVCHDFVTTGGWQIPLQGGWRYRVTSAANFVGSLTVELRQS